MSGPVDDHHEVAALLGVYALDALEPAEVELVEAHLAGCARCRVEVDEHRAMAAALGTGVVELPPALWDRIEGALAQTSRPPADAMAPLAALRGLGARTGTATVVPFGRRRRSLRWAAGAVAAAAVALVAFLAVDLAHTNTQLGQAQQALGIHGSGAAVQAALHTPGRQLVTLRSPEGAQLAEAVVVPGGRGYLVSSSMPRLPAGQTYQLWAIFGIKPISLGLLGAAPDQAGFTVASGIPSQLAVTVEPAGGVSVPDRAPVAAGTLST